MVKVNWTYRAIEDIDNIAEYISKDSAKMASLFVNKIFEKEKLLSEFPLLGRQVPGFENQSLRELIFGNYRIIYKIVTTVRIDILTVHHSSKTLSDESIFT